MSQLVLISAVGATSSNHYIYSVSSLQELNECIYDEVERIDEEASKANNDGSKKRDWLRIKGGVEKQSEEEMPRPNNNILDVYSIFIRMTLRSPF